ncbi:hypothetical protein BI350_15265 [Sporosarcina ureilytica]|uniref:Uncharacterized protein n=1 Tax=Sporosarcina ureilytica TaxID=298596 RepID=A0A1D8JJ85_9BACL|nr:hypothetical protein BI350_15265 [Sporosarcina ureilytica]
MVKLLKKCSSFRKNISPSITTDLTINENDQVISFNEEVIGTKVIAYFNDKNNNFIVQVKFKCQVPTQF